MTETELRMWLERMIAGDQTAFEVVYEHTRNDVYRTVMFLVKNRQDVNEIVNEVYVQMWKSLPSYDQNRSFRFWLHGLIIRQVQDWRRKAWRRLRLAERKQSMEVEEEVLRTDKIILQNETREELISAIQKLSYKLRVVTILRYFHDYSFEEIASILKIPVGTVKSRHHLALRELRQRYETSPKGKVETPYVH